MERFVFDMEHMLVRPPRFANRLPRRYSTTPSPTVSNPLILPYTVRQCQEALCQKRGKVLYLGELAYPALACETMYLFAAVVGVLAHHDLCERLAVFHVVHACGVNG